ncbi:SMU1112c/YaeR family gloxylase I-like metalloprotein [Furfurilactobacillus curtus]|uniref:VOC family protein n=1 Tax=Furfurilactobacillus curtus TaxID=1746200 RepID=A0ABQ5JQE3_9LACO
MELGTLHHIAIVVSNYAKAKDFYMTKLGFQLVSEYDRPVKHDTVMMLVAGNVQIELFVRPNSPSRLSYPEALGLRHIAFQVNDVAQTVIELAELGVKAEPIRHDEFTGKAMTFIQDPDGQPIELHE